ncbi:MAG: PDZ domain-containing protein [Candidatus Aminicenantes bacterium]|nr:PDZ domain-containing protein [Candidatus Aminicenantes bacterium]
MFQKAIIAAAAAAVLAAGQPLPAAVDSAAQEQTRIEALIRSVHPSVVKVESRDGRRKIATGVVMDDAGHIVTTALISSPDENISVLASDGRWITADFLGLDPETHIAVIRAKEKGLPAITLGSASRLGPGAWIAVVGVSPENTPSVTQGIVSSVSDERLRLNVWVMPGASGSPVVDAEGRMIGLLRGVYADESPVVFEFREREVVGSGMVWSRAESPAAGMAAAVPVETVKAVFQEIRDTGKVRRGWLGVTITDGEDNAVIISSVEKGSPAARAELKEGDVALKFNGRNVGSAAALASAVRRTKPGEEATLRILRKGKTLDIRVAMGEYPEKAAHRELSIKFPELFAFPPLQVPEILRIRPPGWGRWEKRKYIGVFLQETSPDLAGHFGLREGRGLLVNKISEGGPAEKAGLRVGDLIFKADGKRVETVAALSAVVQSQEIGGKIKIEFIRDRKVISVLVEIAEEEFGNPFGRLSELAERSAGGLDDVRKSLEKSLQETQAVAKKEKERIRKHARAIFEEQEKVSQELLTELREKTRKIPFQDWLRTYGKFFSLYRI